MTAGKAVLLDMHERVVKGDGVSIAAVVISDLRRGIAVVVAVATASMVEGDMMDVARCWGACTDTIKKLSVGGA